MCGCEQRQQKLNTWHPGLGDKVKIAIRLLPIIAGISLLVYWRKR